MVKPIFYFDKRSPPVRSVFLLIEALKLDVNYVNIDLFKAAHLSEEFVKINPLHTVPALKDDTLVLTDSHSILIHLVEKYGGENNPLWPQGPQRIRILNKLFYSGTNLFRRDSDAIGGIIHKKLRAAAVEEHVKKIREQYGFLEHFLSETKYIADDHLTIADLSIVTIVSTVDMILPVTKESWPKLYNWWYNVMKKLPYYEKANTEGLTGLKALAQQSTDFPINFA